MDEEAGNGKLKRLTIVKFLFFSDSFLVSGL